MGLGRRKDILTATDHYDIFVALEPNVIQFVDAKDVNKKTNRTKPEDLHAGLTRNTRGAITDGGIGLPWVGVGPRCIEAQLPVNVDGPI